jgi:hypothetical protein
MQINNIAIGSPFLNLQPQVSGTAALSSLFGTNFPGYEGNSAPRECSIRESLTRCP